MQVMKRETWPQIMHDANESVLILAPWIDDALVEELFSFIPPIDVRVLFPRSTLVTEASKQLRYSLRGVPDTNFDAEVRVTEAELPACLVVDGRQFYYSETYRDRLPGKAADTESAIAYAESEWGAGEPLE